MKKNSLWAGIIGGILVVSTIYAEANLLANPTNLSHVNLALGVSNLLWIGFGIFLFLIYLKGKQKEDAGHISVKFEPDSPEDVDLLGRKRNWILGFFLLVEIIGSTQTWILNDYTAGLTLVNIMVIFDLVINLILFYIVVELFRNKRDVSGLLFYVIIIFALGEGSIDIFRHHWFGAFLTIFLAFYVMFAIKMPLNRRNHRISHLVILPALVALMLTATYFDNGNIDQLTKNDILLEQEFLNDTDSLNTAYSLFLQREKPDTTIIQEVLDAEVKRDVKIQECISNLEALQAEYEKQLPSVSQQETIERLRYIFTIFELYKKQGDKVEELMNYTKKVDFTHLSDEQRLGIGSLKKEIDGFNTEITRIQFELNSSNLIY